MAEAMKGIWAKIGRAEEHIANLKAEIDEINASDQPLFRVESGLTPDQREFRFTGYASATIPERLVTIASDAIQNLRVPLDHMIWALAEKHGAKKDNKTIGFMAYADPVDFAKNVKKKSPIGPAVTVLEQIQPYHAAPADSPLFVLVDLHNRDKHRSLLAVRASGKLRQSNTVLIDAGQDVTVEYMSPAIEQTLTPEGAVLFAIRFTEPAPRATMKMPEGFDIGVALEGAGSYSRLNVTEALTKFASVVKGTIRLFEPFL